jgi:hypothetical protein
MVGVAPGNPKFFSLRHSAPAGTLYSYSLFTLPEIISSDPILV